LYYVTYNLIPFVSTLRETRVSSLDRCEAALVAEQRDFEDTRASILARELVADTRECTLETRVAEVADRERLLAEQQMQELAAAQKWLDDLQVVRVGEAQKVWEFLRHAESAIVPFGFSPLWSGVPAQEVSAELSLLGSTGTMMLELEDLIANRLEAEGCILVEVVAEHVLLCLRSQDPQVSLEPMVQGPTEQILETAQVGVRAAAKVLAERFERQPEYA
jgi:hypothetical protein